MNNGAVGLLDTPKFDTFYRVFKKAFENKRSSKPFDLLPFGASLHIYATVHTGVLEAFTDLLLGSPEILGIKAKPNSWSEFAIS